jgi:two-component system, cell cycle sensor histidine kinase and response regulator CckA
MCAQTLEIADVTGWDCGLEEATLRGAETILFVEDEEFVRDVTREVLLSAGYKVLTAGNASEALVAYGEHSGEVELLLTDVILPGATGRTLAARLVLKNPGLSVLFVTGYAEQMAVRESEHASCLAKPFSTGVLLRKVREALDGREARAGEQNVRHASSNA